MDADDRAARQDIADVLIRYSTGIDRRDWELFRTCFTDDFHGDYGDLGTFDGVDAITDYMRDTHVDLGHTMHQLSNIAVTVDGDTATAQAYIDAIVMLADGASGINALGFYDDELVRTDAGWRFSRRRFTSVHMRPLGG